jgi:hypothetical protein
MTLHAIMQESVGMELRERYKPERAIPHGLLVILMQMNEDKGAGAARAAGGAGERSAPMSHEGHPDGCLLPRARACGLD